MLQRSLNSGSTALIEGYHRDEKEDFEQEPEKDSEEGVVDVSNVTDDARLALLFMTNMKHL